MSKKKKIGLTNTPRSKGPLKPGASCESLDKPGGTQSN